MGTGLIHICKKCNKENPIYYGVGMQDFPSHYTDDNFKNLIELGKQEKLYNINKLLEFIKLNNVIIEDNYEHYAYICDNCHIIHNKFRYTLISGNKVFYPKYKCDYCGKLLRKKKNNEDYKLKCKYCGSEEFQKQTLYMNWD